MQTISDFLAPRRLFTTADLDGWLLRSGESSRDHRRWVLAMLHSTGDLTRIRRGLYVRTWTDDAMPGAHHLAGWFAKNAILGLRTALEVRGIVPRPANDAWQSHRMRAWRRSNPRTALHDAPAPPFSPLSFALSPLYGRDAAVPLALSMAPLSPSSQLISPVSGRTTPVGNPGNRLGL